MTPELIVEYASVTAIAILVVALLLTVYRAVIGPTLPDRIIALDMQVGIVIGFIAVIALRPGYTRYIDIAIALGLARFILARGYVGEGEEVQAGPPVSKAALTKGTSKAAGKTKTGKSGKSLGKEAK